MQEFSNFVDIKDLTDKELMQLYRVAQETRNGRLYKKVVNEINRRESEI